MGRSWSPQQRAEQAERARRMHAEGKLSGGAKVPRKLRGDRVLDLAEKHLLERLSDPKASDGAKDRAAAAVIRLARVKGDRESPTRQRFVFAIHSLPSVAQLDAAVATLPAEDVADFLLEVAGSMLMIAPDTFRPLIEQVFGELTNADVEELREAARRRAYAAGNTIEAESEADALAVAESMDIEERAWGGESLALSGLRLLAAIALREPRPPLVRAS